MMQSLEDARRLEERCFHPAEDAIMRALSDHFSRIIVLSTTETPKSVEEISRENNIPLSTCYRRVGKLSRQGILVVERVIITPAGKKYVLHRATVKGIHADLSLGHLTVSIERNEDISDKLHSRWLSTRFRPIDREERFEKIGAQVGILGAGAKVVPS